MTSLLNVQLSDHHYPLHIGAGLIRDRALLKQLISAQQVFVISDQHVAAQWLATLRDALCDWDYAEFVIAAGEEQKSLANFSIIIDAMVAAKRRRNCCVIALGGGVVGDLAGFVAACYQRGVDIVQIPTTLLAQVDSSVGGKTAVNHPAGKNLLGAFHHPVAVLADLDTLSTLPRRERQSGFAEIVKYGVIHDAEFFARLSAQQTDLNAGETNALQYAIARSCAIKAWVVNQDPREQGLRAILNFGHTFAHAIETELGYGAWLHGEAVAVGMVLATKLAQLSGHLREPDLLPQLIQLLRGFELPTALPASLNREHLLAHMALDKKNISATPRFILPLRLGEVAIVDGIASDLVLAAMA